MGTTAHVLVVAESEADEQHLLDRAQARIDNLEQRWSRFIPTSELSRLNAAGGRLSVVSELTFEAVSRAVDAWFLTEGRFDPTVLPALKAAGYDRTFEAIDPAACVEDLLPPLTPGCAEIRLAPTVNGVTLPKGVELDLGGIGKGYAADLVAEELVRSGAVGALVSIGGDLRCIGTPPWDEGWLVEVDDPFEPDATAQRLVLEAGAVATTTRTKRAWTTKHANTRRHHIIDPRTGLPADTGIAAVTVVSGEAWWAEVYAKAAFLAGPDEALAVLEGAGVTGFVTLDDGTVRHAQSLESFAG
jgi:FAD:protein FMN transferase